MKRDQFAADIAKIKQEEDEIATLAMLLDAVWSPELKLFVKTDRGVGAAGIPWHWTTYFDRSGAETGKIDMTGSRASASQIKAMQEAGKARIEEAARRAGKSMAALMVNAVRKVNVYRDDIIAP